MNPDVSGTNVFILTLSRGKFVAESLNLVTLFHSGNSNDIEAKDPCFIYSLDITVKNKIYKSMTKHLVNCSGRSHSKLPSYLSASTRPCFHNPSDCFLWPWVPEAFHRDLWPGLVRGFQQREATVSRYGKSLPGLLLLQLAPPLSRHTFQVTQLLSQVGLG